MDVLFKLKDNNDIDKYTDNHKDILSVTSLYLFLIGIAGIANDNFYTKWCGVYILYFGVISTIFWNNFEKGGYLHIADKFLAIIYLLQFLIVNAIYGYKFLSFRKTLILATILCALFTLSDKLLMSGNIEGSFWCHIFFRYFVYISMLSAYYQEISDEIIYFFSGIYFLNILFLKNNV
jgi:hypothetical protein